MIRFVCTCGKRLKANDDEAGSSLQCPACGLLVDVPNLSDLASFAEDGTYRLDADRGPFRDDPDRLDELGIIYSKDKRDAEGNEIDLRTLPGGAAFYADEAAADDAGEIDLKPREQDTTSRPKYDPETGELIKPLEVRRDPDRDVDPASIPVARAALNYAASDLSKSISPLRVAVELLMPMNLVVMFFILCAHLFSGVVYVVTQLIFFVVPGWFILQVLILAHYGNVIDDTGRNEQDDLPRPLREVSFYDDIWSPLLGMVGGLVISYAIPILILLAVGERAGVPAVVMVIAGGIVGTLVGPAVLLTTAASGSMLNLRPDRVLKVIRVCGMKYFGAVVLWAVTLPVYLVGWHGFDMLMRDTFGISLRQSLPPDAGLLILPALVVGVYLMHWFCWYLGLLYKAHHAEFPWVLQRYIRDPGDRPRATHADRLGRKRPAGGHLLPPAPPSPPPSGAPRADVR